MDEVRFCRRPCREETLAVFDLLKKRALSAAEIKRIKEVAIGLLQTLKAEKLKIDHWRDKETTRDAVRVTFQGFLWSDKTGLPVGLYPEDEVKIEAKHVFRYAYRAYPTIPSAFYSAAA